MPVTLTYHQPGEALGTVSPIDEAIDQMVRGQHVDIVCPYIGLPYLKRIIKQASSWKLLSDVEQWIVSQSENSRKKIYNFITMHPERVHHYRDLHAKVIIAEEKAVVGSANFTEKGITRRIEMCVLFQKTSEVAELRVWFDTLWQRCAPVDSDALARFILSAPNPINSSTLDRLNSPAQINSKLASSTKEPSDPIAKNSREARDRLVERVKMAPSRQWINGYFDLIKGLIEFCDLKNDDPRVCMSLPERRAKIQVNLNMRVVLHAYLGKGSPWTGFLFGPKVKLSRRLENIRSDYEEFKARRGEDENELPYYVSFPGMPTAILSDYFDREWKIAASAELQRRKGSPIRDLHQPLIYKAAVDVDYRTYVLDKAFPSQRGRHVNMFTAENLAKFNKRVGEADKHGCRKWLGRPHKYTGKNGVRDFGLFRVKNSGYAMNQRFAFIMAQPANKRDTDVKVEPVPTCALFKATGSELCCTPSHIRAKGRPHAREKPVRRKRARSKREATYY